jgi:hypothetical protein
VDLHPCGCRSYFFFFAAAFFFGAAFFLVAFFIGDSPDRNLRSQKKSQRDSYIELLEKKVKQKIAMTSREFLVARNAPHPIVGASRIEECEVESSGCRDVLCHAHKHWRCARSAVPLPLRGAIALSSSKRILFRKLRSHHDSRSHPRP